MSPIKKVAVIGGSGNLGPVVIQQLLAAGFEVTAVSRASSSSTFPEGVAVEKVDLASLESVRAALAGHDAVVSTVATVSVGGQHVLVDAAIAAGVRRFVPSEFGINTRIVGDTPIGKILTGKVATVDYLTSKADENPWFSWTAITTGFFFDWGLEHGGLGIDLAAKTATVVDSGNEKWASSNLAHIGKAVVTVLQHPDKSANKYLSTASFNVSQAEIVKAVEDLTGSRLAIERLDSRKLQQAGEEKLARGDYSAFGELVRVWNYADGAGHTMNPEDNLGGLLAPPSEDPKDTIKAWLTKVGAL